MSSLVEKFAAFLADNYQEKDLLSNTCWERFRTVPLPEDSRTLQIENLYKVPFTLPSTQSKVVFQAKCPERVIVFVNGVYQEALSQLPEECVILPLTAALSTYGNFLRQRWTKQSQSERDPFALLNGAFTGGGVFIYLPPECVVEEPVEILHITTSESSLFLSPRIHLFASHSSSIKLLYRSTIASSAWVNSFFDLNLEREASVDLINSSTGGAYFDTVRATVKKDAKLRTVSIAKNSSTVKRDYHIQLAQEGADARLYGLTNLGHKEHENTNILMEHAAPCCTSLQHFKGIFSGVSRNSFSGKIFVHKIAQKTNAYQMHNSLLRDPNALSTAQPNLEIFADDVKASHGATCGALDQDSLFYLISRGIPKEKAVSLLLAGFGEEILAQLFNRALIE